MNEIFFRWSIRNWSALIFGALLTLPLAAQTNAPNNISNRYLFIVDTSSAMRRRAPAVETAVENLLLSSMHAQLQRGDTVGVWTYNQTVSAGRLPLQTWAPEATGLVASNVVTFLRRQRYEHDAHFEVVLPMLQRLVADSGRLTVLLISDGTKKINGTPFDDQINEVYQRQSRAQEKAKMPFITVVRVYHGKIINASVNLAPWPVEIPALPPEPKLVEKPKPKPVVETKPRPSLPPLIVIGKKPEPPATNSVTAPSLVTNAVVPVSPVTNAIVPAPVTAKESEKQAAIVSPPAPPPTVVQPTPPPVLVQAQTDLPKPPEVILEKPAEQTPPQSVATVALRPIAVTEVPPEKPSPPAPGPETKTAGQPPAAETVPESQPEPKASPVVPSTGAATPPTQVATATHAQGLGTPGNIAIAGVVILILVGGIFILMRRPRTGSARVSLITRSMDKDKKG